MPLVWGEILEPHGYVFHEVNLKNVVRREIPVERVWVLRTNDRDVPIPL